MVQLALCTVPGEILTLSSAKLKFSVRGCVTKLSITSIASSLHDCFKSQSNFGNEKNKIPVLPCFDWKFQVKMTPVAKHMKQNLLDKTAELH